MCFCCLHKVMVYYYTCNCSLNSQDGVINSTGHVRLQSAHDGCVGHVLLHVA